MLSLHPDYISAGKNKGRHLLDVSPVSHQGTDAVQAPRASGLVNGRLALTVRFVNAGSCLNQPDEALRMSPESGNVGWGLRITRSADIKCGSSSDQLY